MTKEKKSDETQPRSYDSPDSSRLRNLVAFGGIFFLFVVVYALFRPVFLSLEPNPYPAIGNSIFYSLKETTEGLYFYFSFFLFAVFCLIFYKAGLVRFAAPGPEPKTHVRKTTRAYTAAVFAVFVLPWITLLFTEPPLIFLPDYFHHGERLIHQDKPFAEAYKTFYPFKNIFFFKLFLQFGFENNIAAYLFMDQLIIGTGFILIHCLLVLIFRLMNGYYSIIHLGLFFAAYWTGLFEKLARFLVMQRLLFFLLFLVFFTLFMIYRKRGLLFVSTLVISVQFLVSLEFAAFGSFSVVVYFGLKALYDRRGFFKDALVAAAGGVPVAAFLLYNGQMAALAGFLSYTTNIPHIHGIPLLYNFGSDLPPILKTNIFCAFILIWLLLLATTGILVYKVFFQKAVDGRHMCMYLIVLLSVLAFKVGLGRSDLHIMTPLLLCIIPFYTVTVFTFVQKGSFWGLIRNDKQIKAKELEGIGCIPIDKEDIFELFYLGDMPYNIGRSPKRQIDFTLLQLSLEADAVCTYSVADRAVFEFNGKEGSHTYALYPDLSPVYAYAEAKTASVECVCAVKN